MRSSPNFVHLHLHSEYSLLDGACRIDDIVKKAVELDMPAVGLTDHGVMYGSMEFYTKCKKAGIKPIVGCEVYVATRARQQRENHRLDGSHHLVLLAKNETGYKNLIKLVSLASLEGFYYKPRVDKEILSQYSEGLICLSACLGGEVPEHCLNNALDRARFAAAEYREIFGKENYYLEIQDHTLVKQQVVNEQLAELSRELDLPLVATNDVHYLTADDADPHQVLLCIQTSTTLDDPKKMNYGAKEFFLKDQAEMARVFADFPDALARTCEIADRCSLDLEFGRLAMPSPGDIPDGMNAQAYMNKLCLAGLTERYKEVTPAHEERLRYELEVIEKTGFAMYFLIVRDFAQFARRQGIYFGVRGSAACSIASYCLGITDLDPIEYGLAFERFLNPERASMPDIDMDFEDGRRQEVIDYVVGKYGRDRVAQIITFGTLAARAAVRDSGRAMGEVPMAEVDKLCKMIPTLPVGVKLDQALEKVPEFKAAYEGSAQVKNLIDTARRLEGLTRHDSVHAAGVVIAADPLWENVPLQKADDGTSFVTQYPAAMLEKIGLLKMDFLGLANLTILARTVKNVQESVGQKIDVWNLPLDDAPTYELLGRGDTTGIFQLESAQMRRYIAELKPTSIGDIAAMVALYRPGPMAHIPRFIKCKHGMEKIRYPHESLEPILKETYGVIVYQEQVMQIARAIAGFTLGQAYILIKAVSKKIRKEMAEQRHKFIDGAVAHEHKQEKAEALFDMIEPFAGYAFNKGHAACYAMLAYQTAYFKANYPVEYFAALMATQAGDTDKLVNFIEDARRQEIEVLVPDVNKSEADFTVEEADDGKKAVRFGLFAIKNIGRGPVEMVFAARREGQAFASLYDFCLRVQEKGFNSKTAVETLIKAGALASIEADRSRLLAGLEQAWSAAARISENRRLGQVAMFDTAAGAQGDEAAPTLPTEYRKITAQEQMATEKELLGVYLSDHPLDQFAAKLSNIVTHSCAQARQSADRDSVVLAGVLTNVRPYNTKGKNEQMFFLTLEDKTGSIAVTLFPRGTVEFGQHAIKDSVVLIEGRVSHRDRINKSADAEGSGTLAEVVAEKIQPVASVPALAGANGKKNGALAAKNGNGAHSNGNGASAEGDAGRLHIRIGESSRGHIRPLHSALSSWPGEGSVFLHVSEGANKSVTVQPFLNVCTDRSLVDYLRTLLGDPQAVWTE